MPFNGAYTLDLYCDYRNPAHEYGDFPEVIVGENFADCVKQARGIGWTISRNPRRCRCPKCKDVKRLEYDGEYRNGWEDRAGDPAARAVSNE